jgi:hypothetical protein
LKKLFISGEKKVIKEVKLGLNEIEPYLSGIEARATQELEKEFLGRIEKIRERKQIALEKIEELEKAELKNKKIPSRMISIMQGNRETYTKFVRLFLDNLDFNNKDAAKFIEKTKKELESLNKNSLRAYMVLKNFFEDEGFKIAEQIKGINDEMTKLEQLTIKEKIDAVKAIRQTIAQMKNRENENIEIESKVKDINQKIKDIEMSIKFLKAEMAQTEDSEDFKQISILRGELMAFEAMQRKLIEKVNEKFLPLSHALKRYERFSQDKEMTRNYAERPFDALAKDVKISIIYELKRMHDLIMSNKLDVESKKKNRVMSALESIKLQDLSVLAEDIRDMNGKINAARIDIDRNDSLEKLEMSRQNIRILETKITEMQRIKESLARQKTGNAELIIGLKKMFIEKLETRLEIG